MDKKTCKILKIDGEYTHTKFCEKSRGIVKIYVKPVFGKNRRLKAGKISSQISNVET